MASWARYPEARGAEPRGIHFRGCEGESPDEPTSVRPLELAGEVLLDVVDGVLDAADFLGVFVRDVDLEGLLEGQHELN